MKNIAIFASGSGTNAENLIRFFRTSPFGEVKLVLTNREDAGVIDRAQSLKVETIVFTRVQFYQSEDLLHVLIERDIAYVVLAGFLWLVPEYLLKHFKNKMLNVHPALLPNYGGKGMYGHHVHAAVLENREHESGITIHRVNREYDDGNIVFQARCEVLPDDTPESLAARIHRLEYEHFPVVVEQQLKEL